jgi:signal transduction histidine kinase
MIKLKPIKNSIKNKIIIQFTLIISVFLLLISFSIGYLFIKNTESHAQDLLKNRALLIEEKIQERLYYLIEQTKLLAKNSLMINSLIDDDNKEEYLLPLALNFMEDKNVKYLNIIDFDGEIIFKTTENVPKYSNSIYIRNALALGQTTFYLEKNKNEFIVVSPVKYYETTQGALIATFNLDKILSKYIINSNDEYIEILDTQNDKLLYINNHDKNQKYYSYSLKNQNLSLFDELNITLNIGKLESTYLFPIQDALKKVIIMSFILILIGTLLSYLLAESITKPIIELYKKIENNEFNEKYQPLGTNDELEVLSLAFHEKVKQLNQFKNEELENQKLLLEQSKMAALGEMIGNIAHQWRQPLSVISTASSGLKMKQEYGILEEDEMFSVLDSINENTQYLSKTIDDFRNFIIGKREKRLFNLSEQIDSFLSLMIGSIKTHDIHLIRNEQTNIEINGYPNELTQCLMNIVNNSKDAFEEKGIKEKYIFIKTYTKNSSIFIEIKDNAEGIKEDIIPKIFEPYFTTKHKSRGTGLGLSMTYRLITEGMKGNIKVKNTSFKYKDNNYKGAEFTITLPIIS